MKRPSPALLLALPLAVGLSPGCDRSPSGGVPGGGSSLVPTATGRFLLHDAAASDLSSFAAEVSELAVVYDDGSVSKNLLTAPVRVELLTLEDVSAWIAQSELETGAVTEIEIGFTPSSYSARAKDGSPVDVDALSDVLRAPLVAEADLEEDELVSFVIDLDLLASLRGDVASGMIDFDPQGLGEVAPPGALLTLDGMMGLVQGRDTGTLELVVEAFADDARAASLGSLAVRIDPDTLLLDRDLRFDFVPAASFYTILYPGATLVELHGVLESDGALLASRVEIEDQDGGAGSTFPVKLRGTVIDRTAGALTLRLQEVTKGEQLAGPVLQGMADPSKARISLTTQRLRVLLGDEVLDPSTILIGDCVDVKFQNFSAEPFPAAVVEIRRPAPGRSGTITDTTDLPDSLLVELRADDPAVTAGLVLSASTPVLVELQENATSIVLGTFDRPRLDPADLIEGLAVRVGGDLSGPADRPVLSATRLRVTPGLLAGAEVTGVDPTARHLTTAGGEIVGSFGCVSSPGPFAVDVVEGAVLVGAAATLQELEDVLLGLGAGEVLRVDVEGVGTGLPDGIRAHVLRTAVQAD